MMTVVTIRMKDKIVQFVVLHNSNVKMADVLVKSMFAMEQMTVVITRMNPRIVHVLNVRVLTRHVYVAGLQ